MGCICIIQPVGGNADVSFSFFHRHIDRRRDDDDDAEDDAPPSGEQTQGSHDMCSHSLGNKRMELTTFVPIESEF